MIKNTPKGTDVFYFKGVHQWLAFVIEHKKENPGKAK